LKFASRIKIGRVKVTFTKKNLNLAVDFLTIAVLTQSKAVAKARNPKSPEHEIQTGLNCGYDGLSEVILSFTHPRDMFRLVDNSMTQ
jgi:hypothetical protein